MIKNNLTSCTVSNCNPCDCFDKLSQEELDLIKKNEVIVKYKKGEIICKQGTFASHIMIVQKGLVKVFIDGNTNTLILRIVPTGGMLGLTSLAENSSILKYSALAYVDSEIKLIESNTFKDIVSKNASFALEIINILSANKTQINGRFYCLTYKQSYGKLADILICLADNIFKQTEFELSLSRKDLGELSGMSTESVIRMLKKFKDDKIIDMKGKTLKIIDYPKLQEISELG